VVAHIRTFCFLLLVFVGVVACAAHSPDSGKKATLATLEKDILKESLAGKLVYVSRDPLPGGTLIPAWRTKIQVPPEFSQARFYFIDDAPRANWEHPCRYVFVDTKTQKHAVIKASAPPDDMSLMIPLNENSSRVNNPSKGVP
jgi:hypothetical protein